MVDQVEVRLRKRIVEVILSGFENAYNAVQFGNTAKEILERTIDFKFDQQIAAPNTKLAITVGWDGPTVLKLIFMEIDQDKALFVRDTIRKMATDLSRKIEQEVIREKPQHQTLDVALIPKTAVLLNI